MFPPPTKKTYKNHPPKTRLAKKHGRFQPKKMDPTTQNRVFPARRGGDFGRRVSQG